MPMEVRLAESEAVYRRQAARQPLTSCSMIQALTVQEEPAKRGSSIISRDQGTERAVLRARKTATILPGMRTRTVVFETLTKRRPKQESLSVKICSATSPPMAFRQITTSNRLQKALGDHRQAMVEEGRTKEESGEEKNRRVAQVKHPRTCGLWTVTKKSKTKTNRDKLLLRPRTCQASDQSPQSNERNPKSR